MSPQATEELKPSGSPAPPPDKPRIGVTGTQVAASVLASVSSAVVASFFGVTGTIVGAAVVSVVATVGSAAYGLGLRRTQARLQQVQVLRIARPLERPPVGGDATVTEAEAETEAEIGSGAGRVRPRVTVADRWRAWLSQRRWSLAAGVAIVLVISLATVSLVELVRDRPLSGGSSGTGGTSLGHLFGGDDDRDPDDGGHDPGTSPTTAAPTDSPSTTGPAAGSAGRSTTATDGSSSTTTSTAPPATSTTAVPTTTPTTVAPPGGLTDRTG